MGLREALHKETVADLPLRQPILVGPRTTVAQAADLMREKQHGCVFVVDEHHKPLGKFTQHQLMQLLVNPQSEGDRNPLDNQTTAYGTDLQEAVENVMYRPCETVNLRDTIAHMAQLMNTRQIRYLAVVDDAGAVVGLTGQKGLIEYITDCFPRQIKVQRMISQLSLGSQEGG